MRSRLLRAFGLTVLVCAGAVVTSAAASASGAADAKAAKAGAARASAAAVHPTSIMGAAWKSDNSPIPGARLRLRNVLTGKVEATTVANGLGQFAFNDIETGSYVIELVSDSGKILTIGHTFTVGPGETVATFVRLGTKVPWFTGFFGNAATAVSSTAASVGVTAVAPETLRAVSATK